MSPNENATRTRAFQLFCERRDSRALDDWFDAERELGHRATPRRLFKYVGTAAHHFAILENLEIRFSQPSALNDPRDCRPNVTAPENIPAAVEHMLQRNLARYARPLTPAQIDLARQTLMRSYTDDIDQRISESAEILRGNMDAVGVLSLTDVADNVVMWAHYAENHCGFVIEFDTQHSPLIPQSDESGWQGRPVPVTYRESRVQVPCNSASLELPDEVVLVKTSAWQYEREWRVVRDRSHASRILTPNGTEISLFDITPEAITAVYVGNSASDATEDRLRSILQNRPALRHVRLVRAKVSVQGDVVI